MVYASSRARIVQYAEQEIGLKIAKRVSLLVTYHYLIKALYIFFCALG